MALSSPTGENLPRRQLADVLTDLMPPRLVGCSSCSICHSDVTDGDPRGRGEAHDPLKPLDWHHKPPSPGNYGAWRPSAASPLGVTGTPELAPRP